MYERTRVCYFANVSYHFLRQRPQQLFHAWLAMAPPGWSFQYVDPPWVNLRIFERDRTFLVGLNAADRRLEATVRHLLGTWLRGDKDVRVAVASLFWEPFLSPRHFDLICYDYYDQPVPAGPESGTFLRKHRKMLAKSDLVFAATEDFRREAVAGGAAGEILVVSNGVDAGFFEKNKEAHAPADFTKTRPTVGFIGAVFDWVDLDLLCATAREMPGVDFVVVGPLSDLSRAAVSSAPSNLRFLGAKHYAEIPVYLQLCDVMVMPFKPGMVDGADPVTLYEFFALGKPVVASPIAQLSRFADGRLLRTAVTPAEYRTALEFYLADDRPEWKAERRMIAANNSWTGKAGAILAAIERRLRLAPGGRGRR